MIFGVTETGNEHVVAMLDNTPRDDIIRLWVDTMRSDTFEQGRGYLRQDNAFDVSGVLVAVLDCNWRPCGTIETIRRNGARGLAYKTLPTWIAHRLGITTSLLLIRPGDIEPCCSLVVENDRGTSFRDMAEMIEKTLTEELVFLRAEHSRIARLAV